MEVKVNTPHSIGFCVDSIEQMCYTGDIRGKHPAPAPPLGGLAKGGSSRSRAPRFRGPCPTKKKEIPLKTTTGTGIGRHEPSPRKKRCNGTIAGTGIGDHLPVGVDPRVCPGGGSSPDMQGGRHAAKGLGESTRPYPRKRPRKRKTSAHRTRLWNQSSGPRRIGRGARI